MFGPRGDGETRKEVKLGLCSVLWAGASEPRSATFRMLWMDMKIVETMIEHKTLTAQMIEKAVKEESEYLQ